MSWDDHRPTEVRTECPVCDWRSAEFVVDVDDANGQWHAKHTAIGAYRNHHAYHHIPAPDIVYISRSDAEVTR